MGADKSVLKVRASEVCPAQSLQLTVISLQCGYRSLRPVSPATPEHERERGSARERIRGKFYFQSNTDAGVLSPGPRLASEAGGAVGELFGLDAQAVHQLDKQVGNRCAVLGGDVLAALDASGVTGDEER